MKGEKEGKHVSHLLTTISTLYLLFGYTLLIQVLSLDRVYLFIMIDLGQSGPGHSEEIPLFWATHKGKRWIKSKEELGKLSKKGQYLELNI